MLQAHGFISVSAIPAGIDQQQLRGQRLRASAASQRAPKAGTASSPASAGGGVVGVGQQLVQVDRDDARHRVDRAP